MTVNNGIVTSVPLTTGAIGAIQDRNDYIATKAMPVVLAPKTIGTYKKWDTKDLARYEAELRKAGTSFKKVQPDVEEKSFHALNYGMKTGIAREDANELGGNPLQTAADYLIDQGFQTLETQFFANFLTTGKYASDPTPSVKWDLSNSNPIADVRAALVAGRKAGRRVLNSGAMSEDVFEALIQNQEILDRMPTNELRVLTQEQQLAAVFGLQNIYVSRASNITVNEGASGEATASFGSEKFLLYHKPVGNPMMNPSAGLIIVRDYGSGIDGNGMSVSEPIFDKDTNSDELFLQLAFDMVIPYSECGVLLNNVLS